MATEKQFNFFKTLYDEENEREVQLNQSARANLTLVTFYSAFVLFVVEKLRPSAGPEKLIFLISLLSLAIAFVLSLLALRISTYEAPNDPISIIEGFGDSPPTDEDFLDDRIVDYAVAVKRNSDVNDRKAMKLQIAGYGLLIGMLFHACYFAVKIF